MVEWKKIEDLGPYFGGLTGKTKNDFVDGNAKFITYMNVFANPSLDINTTGVVKIDEGEKQNKIQKGDILFTGSSETPDEAGMSCVVTEDLDDDYYMNSFCFGIRLNNPEHYCLGYLKYILRSSTIRREIAKTANGVTRFNISKARLGKVLIPFPPLQEQVKIAEQLDTFTSSIENLKEQITQRRKQYEYYRDQLLDFDGKEKMEMKPLSEVCLKTKNIKWRSEPEDNSYYYIDLSSVDIDTHQICSVSKINKTSAPSRAQQIVEDGDVLLGTTRPTLKRYCLIPKLYNNHICSTGFCVIRANDSFVSNKWIYYNIAKTKFWDYCERKQQGAGYPSLSNSDAFAYVIPVPSLSEQNRIINILDKFEASIQNLETRLSLREKQYEYYRNKLLTFE